MRWHLCQRVETWFCYKTFLCPFLMIKKKRVSNIIHLLVTLQCNSMKWVKYTAEPHTWKLIVAPVRHMAFLVFIVSGWWTSGNSEYSCLLFPSDSEQSAPSFCVASSLVVLPFTGIARLAPDREQFIEFSCIPWKNPPPHPAPPLLLSSVSVTVRGCGNQSFS